MNKGQPEGTEEEINFVKVLNRKEKKEFWRILGLDPDGHFAIHVISHKFGKINGSKIKPKADIYIAEGSVDIPGLAKADFYLDENSVGRFSLKPVPETGISVKRVDSTRYQILKMNPNTFKTVFGSYELGAGASIYCSKKEELEKNPEVLAGWNIDWEKFEKVFGRIANVRALKDRKTPPEIRLSAAKKIKAFSNKKIELQIDDNKKISEFVFQGIGNFEEPYTAYWLYEHGSLKNAGRIPFVVTTGSGRSKGDFTVVIKPNN